MREMLFPAMAIRVLTSPIIPKHFPKFSHKNSKFSSISPIPTTNSHSNNPISHQRFNFYSNSTTRFPNPISNLLQRYGFSQDFLEKNSFLLNSSPSDVKRSLKILRSLLLCKDSVVSIVYGCPRVLDVDFLEKWELGFSRIGDVGRNVGSNVVVVRNVLEVCRKYDLCPDDVARCVQCLRGLGFSEGTVSRVLESFASVITMDEGTVSSRVEFLLGVGIARGDIDRMVARFPGVLGLGVDNKLMPLFEEFKSLGFGLDEVRIGIVRDPRVLELDLGELSKCLGMLKSLKCRVPVKDEIFRMGAFRAGYETKLRIDCLHKHGLTYRDAFGVLVREPRAILYSIDDIEKKIEFLVSKMKLEISWLIDVPEYLGVHFEKQIVARFNVIEYLRSIGAIRHEVGLRQLVNLTRLKFYNLYVKPYPECEKIYGRFAEVKVRSRFPVGMSALFKPPEYTHSKQDIDNIKSFMETVG